MQQVALNHCEGFAARVTFTLDDAPGPNDPPIQLHGVVSEVNDQVLRITLKSPGVVAKMAGTVRVDIVHPSGLLQFEASPLPKQTDLWHLCVAAPAAHEVTWVQRRRHSRVFLNAPCSLHSLTHLVDGEKWPATVKSLSLGGAALDVSVAPSTGQRLQLWFHPSSGLPESPILIEVIRVDSDGEQFTVGVRFPNLAPEQEKLLAQFIESQQN